MSDADVEATLQEIRERVRAESLAQPPHSAGNVSASSHSIQAAHALARLKANLATTERAWSKIPPVTSFHRRGWTARLEVWLKRQIKRATHWYVFEQVNFNAAVNSALHDTAAILESLPEQRVCLKQLTIEMSEQAILLDRTRRALELRLEEVASRLEELHALRAEIELLRHSSEQAR
ncbi:MAG TPA: hypothetical protein VF544_04930 [Pyrinomonadaceae bacterium]|jgi:hypothetical protein